jgi:hypothetical protein
LSSPNREAVDEQADMRVEDLPRGQEIGEDDVVVLRCGGYAV